MLNNLRTYILRGFILLIPIVLSGLAIRLVYVVIDKRVMGLVDDFLGFSVPGLGIVLLLAGLYLVGLAGGGMVAKYLLGTIEGIAAKIPLVNTTYQVGKQIASTLTLPEHQVLKRAVLVGYLRPGMWTIGFVTGTLEDAQAPGEKLLKVFVPTPPNPTTGTIIIVKESETRDPGWTVEEAMKTVISAGLIGPERVN
ncbi:MAG: DUF502 domain-containing protein [Elusimicrobiota bacterium]